MDREASTKRDVLEHMLFDESIDPTDLPLSLLKYITDSFSEDKQIGRGGFSVVYKGMLRNGTIAVKKLFDMNLDENKFHTEVACLMKAKHKNVVRFFGYCADTRGRMISYNGKLVMADVQQRLLCFEYLPKGSLRDYITDASHELEWTQYYQIIKGICTGLHYLHENYIAHLDLKPSNVLLDDNMVPKIADFGLSRCFDENQSHVDTSKPLGTLGYFAPEFHRGRIGLQSDIYSLGVIITEILTGEKICPEDYDVLERWGNRLEQLYREKQLEQLRVCAEIGKECTEDDPTRRPDALTIVRRLDEVDIADRSIVTEMRNSKRQKTEQHGDGRNLIGAIGRELGVSGEIKKMEDNMESLKCFLADAERRRITEERVQRWVRKLKDAMYDATDVLDLCQLEADKRWESKGGNMDEKAPVFAHEIGSRIKELNQRLDNIHKEANNYKFINLDSNTAQTLPINTNISSQRMTSEFVESTIVGEKIEQETRELAQLLITSDNHDVKVVAIVGTGGMGKTTLAQKLFKETTVQEHFKVKIWLSITQHFDEIEVLKTAIEHAGGDYGRTQDKTLLTRTLTDTLSTGKPFLLVLDDMWNDQAWSQVLRVPIGNASKKQPANWVLITTRLGDLAQRMGASFYQHTVSPLNDEDAWSLLNKQLPPQPNQAVGTDHLRDVGIKIIRKCGGLPLAIKVMGGLLSTKSRSEREWEAVLNNHAWSAAGLPKELDKRIYLSYEDLSPQLKQCFLYCSLFSKGTAIENVHVIPMWISEGFIQPLNGSSSQEDQLEEIATECYHELITRNLIEPAAGHLITRYMCTMHDVVRSFAEFMAKEDSLVVLDKQVAAGSKDNSRVRRMSVVGSSIEWTILQKQESLRTLIMNCKINFELTDLLTSFSRLRVLSRVGGDCDRLVDSLCQLRHLRYFSLEGTNISRLPEDIHRMKFLQNILIRCSRNLKNLPRTIIKLVHLRTLNMYGSNINVVIPKGFGGLTNLRTLYGFPVNMDMDGNWCSLEEIGPLSQLRHLTLHGLENVAASSLAEMAMIRTKEHLDYLQLVWSTSRCIELGDEIEKQQQQHIAEEVLEKLCPPPRIGRLVIEGYFGRMLPNWMMAPASGAFKGLRLLTLNGLPCCTKLPDGLCRLLSLEALHIINAPAIKNVGFEFQAPCSSFTPSPTSAPFPSLTNLVLRGLCEWEWDWKQQTEDVTAHDMAMPALNELIINNCKLRCLPPGLANSKRHALRRLYVYQLSYLTSVENFPSVVELDMFDCPELKRISGLSRMHKIRILRCPKLEALEDVPALDSVVLQDATMETLPGYLQAVNPRYLKLGCSSKMYQSLSPGSSERNKISHIRKLNIVDLKPGGKLKARNIQMEYRRAG